MRNGRPPSHYRAIWVANIMDEHNPRLAPGVRAYDTPIPNIIVPGMTITNNINESFSMDRWRRNRGKDVKTPTDQESDDEVLQYNRLLDHALVDQIKWINENLAIAQHKIDLYNQGIWRDDSPLDDPKNQA